jgi:hypothetical protein
MHRRREPVDVFLRGPKDVKRQALRALRAYARQSIELVDESLDDGREAQV